MADDRRLSSDRVETLWLWSALGLAAALRMLHLLNLSSDPLSFQPGPDEEYYRKFGEVVAAAAGDSTSPYFTFMDPGYGYLLGVIFKCWSSNLTRVFALQAALDTAAVYGVFLIGRLLGRPRAGLWGALLYAINPDAIMFCTSLLKEVWVASFITWWVVAAIALTRADRRIGWMAFGVLSGIGVALRSTLLVLALLAPLVFRFSFSSGMPAGRERADWEAWRKVALFSCGLILSLTPWSLRNFESDGNPSPLPHNSGIVLHQIYNENNPEMTIWIPPFVNYSRPDEIWRGYAAEAARRESRTLSRQEVDAYWRSQAIHYISEHPAFVLARIALKALSFLSAAEVPNNRSLAEERLGSPVLSHLPDVTALLVAFGLVGLLWLASVERRTLIIAIPILMAWLLMALFWPEERFRFHVVPLLSFCSGAMIEQLLRWRGVTLKRQLSWGAAITFILGLSIYLSHRMPPPPVEWDRIAWGYIKMGRLADGRELAKRIATQQPSNGPIFEALGYTAASMGLYDEAAHDYEQAVSLRPRSHVARYNLARAYILLGRRQEAVQQARIALTLYPSPAYQALLDQLASAH